MKPQLCLFTDSLEPSGVGQHMLALAAELRTHYTISLICPPSAGGRYLLTAARDLGLRSLGLEVRFHQPAAQARFCDWLRAQQITIFHCHAGVGWEGFGGIVAARAAGLPVIVRTEHLPYLLTNPTQQADYRRMARLVDRIICVSEGVATSHVAAGVPRHQLRVVRNGITIPGPQTVRAQPRVGADLPMNARRVLTIGRFTEQKGYSYLLDAVPAVLAGLPNAYFLWAGTGELENTLRAAVQQRGLTDRVRFLGRQADVSQLLAVADLLVLPSLFEGLPLVVLEAMAAGLPVVGTRVCGTSEAVVDGVTGRLVPPRDPPALSGAILEVLEHPERGMRWGRAGQVRVRREFTARRMAAETAAIYEELAVRPTTVPGFPVIAYPTNTTPTEPTATSRRAHSGPDSDLRSFE